MGRPRLTEKAKLSVALRALHDVLGADRGVVQGAKLKASVRKLLTEKGYLREILKGWYFVSDPSADEGDTTPFYANFWEYLAAYLELRFGQDYSLNAEHSVLRHAQGNVVPRQVNILLAANISQYQELRFGYSVAMYPGGKTLPRGQNAEKIQGLRCMSAPYALVQLAPNLFATHSADVQVVLGTLQDPSQIAALAPINASGVGRVVSAARLTGRADFADEILRQLAGLGIALPPEMNPFQGGPVYQLGAAARSPLYGRIKLLWAQHRQTVIRHRPSVLTAPSLPDFLAGVEALKVDDAYHSLSIERYRVTPELIQKVAAGDWAPDSSAREKLHVDALAARGYLDAFSLVKRDAGEAFSQEPLQPGTAARLFAQGHQAWFQALFSTSISAGLLESEALIGYRRIPVFLRGSRHTPPDYSEVRDGMTALMECLTLESDAFVRAVLGHWLFGFVHPYGDGNGRLARFLMNVMLSSGGYPWTVIHLDARDRYMLALEQASVENDLEPFATFIADCVMQAGRRY